MWLSARIVRCFQSVACTPQFNYFYFFGALDHSYTAACVSEDERMKKKKQHKNTYTVACHYKQQPLTSRQTRTKRHKTQNESVYTFLYLSLIPDSKLLQSMCGTDNVALPHRWIIYPLPHCFGAISLKLNKTVCTCSTLRKPFPNKTQTL